MKRRVESGLLKKGFQQHNGDHKRFIYYSLSGKKTVVRTKTSNGSDSMLSACLIAVMARQCKLNPAQFANLVNCPLSQQDYENLLRAQGVRPE